MPELRPIADELRRIHESSAYSAQGQFEQMKLWRTMNMVLGIPASALAAAAGGTGLAEVTSPVLPAVLALVAAAFGATLTTLNPSRRVTQAQSAAEVHSKYLKSFHLEMMVSSTFGKLGDLQDACEKFFEWAPNHVAVQDPARHGGDLSSYLTANNRSSLARNLESARQRAELANAAERSGNHAEAIRLWRIIFGDEFPAYGG